MSLLCMLFAGMLSAMADEARRGLALRWALGLGAIVLVLAGLYTAELRDRVLAERALAACAPTLMAGKIADRLAPGKQ